MIQVIDIRKHDPEKVIKYWKSKGGVDVGYGNDYAYPYVGINDVGHIAGYSKLRNEFELIDLPTQQTEPEKKEPRTFWVLMPKQDGTHSDIQVYFNESEQFAKEYASTFGREIVKVVECLD